MIDLIIEFLTDFIRDLLNPEKAYAEEPAWRRYLPLLMFVLTVGSFFLSLNLWADSHCKWILPAIMIALTVWAIIHRIHKL